MNYHDSLCKAIDTLVLHGSEAAENELIPYFDSLKKELKDSPERAREIELLDWWGQGLEVLEEYEQALLKYQRIIEIDWSNKEVLFRMAQLFMHALQKPKHAISILEDKLLKWEPENEEYLNALEEAQLGVDPEEAQIIEL